MIPITDDFTTFFLVVGLALLHLQIKTKNHNYYTFQAAVHFKYTSDSDGVLRNFQRVTNVRTIIPVWKTTAVISREFFLKTPQ